MEEQNRAETSDLVGEHWAIALRVTSWIGRDSRTITTLEIGLKGTPPPDLYELITRYFPTEPWPGSKFCPDA